MKRILQYAAAAVLTLCLCVLLGGGADTGISVSHGGDEK